MSQVETRVKELLNKDENNTLTASERKEYYRLCEAMREANQTSKLELDRRRSDTNYVGTVFIDLKP